MLKPVIAVTALAALAGTSFVYAQGFNGQGFNGQGFGGQGFNGHHGFGGGGRRAEMWHRPSVADVNAFADARIAGLKAGLELTPDQAKNWPPFEQALRDMVQLRVQRLQAGQPSEQQPSPSPFDRLSRRADFMAKRSTALKKIADAGSPLYASLNDEQKGRFVRLARILRPHPHMPMWRHGGGGWNHGDHRFGQNGDDGNQKSEL